MTLFLGNLNQISALVNIIIFRYPQLTACPLVVRDLCCSFLSTLTDMALTGFFQLFTEFAITVSVIRDMVEFPASVRLYHFLSLVSLTFPDSQIPSRAVVL